MICHINVIQAALLQATAQFPVALGGRTAAELVGSHCYAAMGLLAVAADLLNAEDHSSGTLCSIPQL